MSEHARYEELQRQLSAVGSFKRTIVRSLPEDCPAGSTAVLSTLRRHGAVRLSRLAELLALDISVTSRHVSQAVEHGWVERTRDPSDKRSWILSVTASGRDLLDEISVRTTRMLADRMGDWTGDDIDQLAALLARLHDSFAEHRPVDQVETPAHD